MPHWIVSLFGGPCRVNHAAALVDNKIYSFGGYCSTREFNDQDPIEVHILDTGLFRWSLIVYRETDSVPNQRYGHTVVAVGSKNDMPHWIVSLFGGPCRVNHAAALVDNKIYSFGGYCSTREFNDQDPIEVHILDTGLFRWSLIVYRETDSVPNQRYGHTVVAVGSKIYLWGGRNNTTAVNDLSCFNTETLEWSTIATTGTVPFAKDGHSACVINNKMYIFGGFEFLTDLYSQDIHCLDLETFVWRFVPAKGLLPSHRDFHTAVGVGDDMYVFGGRGEIWERYDMEEEEYCTNVYRFNTISEEWDVRKPIGDIPFGRRSHSAWIYKGDMYIFGGYNGIQRMHSNKLYRYSLMDNRFHLVRAIGNGPCERRRQSCVMCGDKMYLFGGTSPFKVADEEDDNIIEKSDLYVLDYAPTLKTLSIMEVLKHRYLNWCAPCVPHHIQLDISFMIRPNRGSNHDYREADSDAYA